MKYIISTFFVIILLVGGFLYFKSVNTNDTIPNSSEVIRKKNAEEKIILENKIKYLSVEKNIIMSRGSSAQIVHNDDYTLYAETYSEEQYDETGKASDRSFIIIDNVNSPDESINVGAAIVDFAKPNTKGSVQLLGFYDDKLLYSVDFNELDSSPDDNCQNRWTLKYGFDWYSLDTVPTNKLQQPKKFEKTKEFKDWVQSQLPAECMK